MDEVIDRKELISRVKSGKLDRSTAVSRNSSDYYFITKDINGRVCLGAVGSKHHLMQKLTK